MTTVMAVHATPKVTRLLEDEKWARERQIEIDSDVTVEPEVILSKYDIFKLSWTYYIPTIAMGAATIACIIGAHTISVKRSAALTSAYYLSETALKEYQTKVIKTIGEKKAQLIKDEIAQDHVNKTKKGDKSIIITGNGDTLCLDLTTGRYFRSSVDKIKKAQNDINYQLLDDTIMSLNEIYDCLGLDHVINGGELGWDRNRDGQLEFDISTCMSENDDPCITISFRAKPNFRN